MLLDMPNYPNTITKHKSGAISLTGPAGTQVFRLAAIKSALNLEAKGIKIRRGYSALKTAKTITGLKTNDRAKQAAALEQLIDAARLQCEVIDETK